MRSVWSIIIVAILTLLALVLIFNPSILKDIWLWLVGLIGPISVIIKKGADSILGFLKTNESNESKKNPNQNIVNNQEDLKIKISSLEEKLKANSNKNLEPQFDGTTITVLRYINDGQSTLGLLFYNEQFFCYTLEDTYRPVKIYGETRIPAGIYKIGFLEVENELTAKYRVTRDWFKYHIHIQNVPGFEGILIHTGSTHIDTKGCLLVANSIDATNPTLNIFNSKVAFEKLYKTIKSEIDGGKHVRIKIFDENWFTQNQFIEQIPSTHKIQ